MKIIEQLTADKTCLERYLKGQGWLPLNEKITAIEIPGAGNMNFIIRVKTQERSLIIKQSREFVEKYPQIEAPAERALREAEFYQLISEEESIKKKMPKLIGVDKKNHVLNLEDLGNGVDYTFLYQKNMRLDIAELEEIITFAARLHQTINTDTSRALLPNREMRKLNHEHIFIYPYLSDNGLDLDDILSGLQEVGLPFKEDILLKQAVKKLGDRYLEDGKALLHGDYFPGSWLKTENGIKIIDPEFCFFGDVEFEMGVTLAHLKMANQPDTLVEKALKIYKDLSAIDDQLCKQFMAVEILRRILGLAQLPLNLDLEERKALLNEAQSILVTTE
ncbi:5-methylthioribose kinase [Psychroflexus torquis ATCC 700755]|uniref:5-methylthioribose kinase n=1 Tax=Psychroflexus torquis (strain ATCC 700755 / CIP 106069 / ACAM 623) TaxID=313595 RepID=K4IEF8_PSYTT|nr:phosphotransferase [Psychroflexus torquis]AFU68942.1 5-methylthioribose kinase [Psychroflexus torquis ATCC 700755]